MKQSGSVLRGGICIFTVPGIQSDMMMIFAGGKKYSAGAVPLRNLKTEEVLVEFQGTRDIRHFEVNVPDMGLCRDDIIQNDLLGVH